MSCGFVSADDQMAGRVGGGRNPSPDWETEARVLSRGRDNIQRKNVEGPDKMSECLGCERTKAGGLRGVGVPRMDLHVRV
jgi:hypothetical protein